MSLIVLASDKGSPGVTTTAVALAGVWPRRAILAECDPAGGDLVYRAPSDTGAPLNPNVGMLSLATTARHGLSPHQLEQHIQRMHGGLELVVGLATGDQSAGLAGLWPSLGRVFDAMPDADVIADCGRVDATGPALELMSAATAVVLIARTSAEQIAHVRDRALSLVQRVGGGTATTGGGLGVPIGVVLIVDPKQRTRVTAQVDELLRTSGLPVKVIGTIADDPDGADLINGRGRGRLDRTLLIRSTREVALDLSRLYSAPSQGAAMPPGTPLPQGPQPGSHGRQPGMPGPGRQPGPQQPPMRGQQEQQPGPQPPMSGPHGQQPDPQQQYAPPRPPQQQAPIRPDMADPRPPHSMPANPVPQQQHAPLRQPLPDMADPMRHGLSAIPQHQQAPVRQASPDMADPMPPQSALPAPLHQQPLPPHEHAPLRQSPPDMADPMLHQQPVPPHGLSEPPLWQASPDQADSMPPQQTPPPQGTNPAPHQQASLRPVIANPVPPISAQQPSANGYTPLPPQAPGTPKPPMFRRDAQPQPPTVWPGDQPSPQPAPPPPSAHEGFTSVTLGGGPDPRPGGLPYADDSSAGTGTGSDAATDTTPTDLDKLPPRNEIAPGRGARRAGPPQGGQ